MNSIAPSSDSPPLPPIADFKDRHTGLVAFGILEILLGALFVLMAGVVVLGQVMMSRTGGAALSMRMMLPAMATYLWLAAAFVWLGIGSIRCRRWARALVLILAWGWLCVGVITMPLMAFLMPRILSASAPNGQALPRGMLVAVIAFQMVFMTLFLIVVPGVLVFFYQSRHVKATCEARDPVRRWTDGCPLPVLAVACGSWLASVSMLFFPVAYGGALPLFGTIFSGLPGTLLSLSLAVLWFWLGRKWYQVSEAGWWVLLAALVVFGISNLITFSRVDIMELYQKMGYPQEQLDLIRRQGWMSSGFMVWTSSLWIVPMLGYLIWVKRFFRATPPAR